jgi:phosphoglycolate phosphatase
MNYQVIIFDWDGTLFDSAALIVRSMQQTARDLELPVPTESDVRRMIGLSFKNSLGALIPNLSKAQIKQYDETFHSYLLSQKIPSTMFEGAEDVLRDLHRRNYKMAIATGRDRAGLDYELKTLPVRDLFLTTRCSNETQSKPHPQMLLEILEELKITPNQALMVGDTEYDILMARAANMDALAVSYGVHDRETLLKHPIKGIIADIRELIPWLHLTSS